MRALRFDRFGPPASALRLANLPEPDPAPGEALVEIRAAAVNPSDVKNVEGKMAGTVLPRTPGRDFAGVVKAGPPAWRGASVWGTGGDLGFTRDGTHAERLRLPVAALRRKPEKLTFAEAAAVGTPFAAALLGLTRASPAGGEVVLVVGAAGSVGSAAVQIAAWRGARTAGLVLDEAQAEVARAVGAQRVVVNGEGDPTAALEAALGAGSVDVAFDTTGRALDACVKLLRPGGRVVAITAPPDGRVTFNLRELYRREGELFGVDTRRLGAVEAATLLDVLAPGFESGALRPPRFVERPLADAVAAYQDAGKIVLVP
ncbi:MAG TPA: zinc-binding alcohol dehydrogenase family protein [Myxococcales bacterium]|nr:zinc-binding alcohol dehydrogenase family protein [Myxococcales bacterium]